MSNLKIKNNERGTAIALALLFAVILLGIGIALAFLTYVEQLTSSYAVVGSQAFYAADVETAYMMIGRNVIGLYDSWDTALGNGQPDATQNCTRSAPPVGDCINEIAQTYEDLQGPWCKGRVLRKPIPDPGWDLTDPALNPFRVKCTQADAFCNCQIIPTSGRSWQQRFSIYVRNDSQDDSILQDDNNEIQLVVVSQMPSLLAAKSVIYYDLSAWSQEGLTYDIHQTGSSQTK